jgi:hypothetical protein
MRIKITQPGNNLLPKKRRPRPVTVMAGIHDDAARGALVSDAATVEIVAIMARNTHTRASFQRNREAPNQVLTPAFAR